MPRRHLHFWLTVACTMAACTSSDGKGSGPPASDAATPPTPDAATPDDAAALRAPRPVCSGCPTEARDPTDRTVRFHHVHLNVTDPAASRAFYREFFGAERVRLNGTSDALWLAPMLFLLNEVAVGPNDTLEMGLDHVGRGSDDPVAWFNEVSQKGVMGDPRQGSQSTPTQIGPLLTFIYVRGPGAERMEVYNTGIVVVPGHMESATEFQHVHFVTPNLDVTVGWYATLLGQPVNDNGLGRDVAVDRVSLFFGSYQLPSAFAPTDDRPLGHIALSVTDLAAMRARVGSLGIEIVAEPAMAPEGFRSFFVRAPEQVLLEFVEAGPLDHL